MKQNYTHEYNKSKGRYYQRRRDKETIFTITYLLYYGDIELFLFNEYNHNGRWLNTNISVITSSGTRYSFMNNSVALDRLLKKCVINTIFYDFNGSRNNAPCITAQTNLTSGYTRVEAITNVYNKITGNFTYRYSELSKNFNRGL